jgi:ribosome biogenesis protein SSF1/2
MEQFTDTEEGGESTSNKVVVDLPLGEGTRNNKGKNSRMATTTTKSALKLVEVGPRLTLELLKVEKGIPDGKHPTPTLYHAYVTKTPQQVAEQQAKFDAQQAAKLERKRIQEENVQRKKRQKLEQQEQARKQRQSNRTTEDAAGTTTTTTESLHEPHPQERQSHERIEGVSSSSSEDEEDDDDEEENEE